MDLMRPELDLALAPSQIQVRMVAFFLGNGADFIYEGHRLGEIFECVEAFKVAVLVECPPTVELLQHLLGLCSIHWRDTATARYAFIICKIHKILSLNCRPLLTHEIPQLKKRSD